MSEPTTAAEVELKSLRDRPFELLAELERRGRAVSAQLNQEASAGHEWVGVALRMAGDLYLVAREETREVLGVPASTTRVPGARPWIKGLANVRGQLLPIIDLRQFLGSGVTPVTRNTRIVVVNHREIPAGLIVDEVLGFRRFAENEFTARRAAHGGALRALPCRRLPPRPGAVAGPEPAPGARESRVRGGGGVNRTDAQAPSGLALLLGAAALLLAGSGVAYWFALSRPAPEKVHSVPVEALYALALDADGAVAGDAAALTRFQERQKQLEEAAARDAGASFASDARFTRLMNNATAVLRARSALADAGAAAHDTATLVPRLIGEAQALGQTLPPVNGAPPGAPLERFEARAQRLQLDVTALTQGAADPGQAAQHMAESSDYLGQVIAALAGATSALALPKVTAPEGLKHLKNLDSTYQELAAAVKRAVAAAPALPAAQSAARAIAADARDLAATQPPAAPQAAAGLSAYLPLVLLAAGLAFLTAALVSALRMHRTVERQRGLGGRAAQGERPQPAGDPAPAR